MIHKLGQINLNIHCVAMLVLVLLFCVAGCSRESLESSAAEGQPKAQKTAAMENQLLPDQGTVTVKFSDHLLTVLSNCAPRLSVVKQVARAAGFEFVAGDVEPQTLTVRIVKSKLAQALPVLLADLPYDAEYVFDPDRKVHVLARLHVGGTQAFAATALPDDEAEFEANAVADESWLEPPLIDDQGVDGLQSEVEELMIAQAELFDRVESSAPQVRAETIPEIPIAGEGLDVILDALALNPDTEVRAAAAQRLATAKDYATMDGLINALDDPAPEVALQAIRSLVAIGDRSIILNMQNILDRHSDPTVQQALEEGIKALEFSVRTESDGIEIDLRHEG
ncbi:MAG: HEAT repeat domain-containing protein [Thermodesulfobacteriota bacterium]|nr:HEAT repeat domain-containing protein [Thermodesulfobacteriota bacterium]